MDTGPRPPARPVIAPETINPAPLTWRDQQPYSHAFEDIYHAPDGVAEVLRVFAGPTGVQEKAARNRDLLVGELGFGTGLNFAVTAELILAAGARLHFVSVDAAPIDPQAFRDLCARRQAQQPIYRELAEQYPPLIRGWHRRSLANGRVTLSLFWGPADVALNDIREGRQRRGFDAWYLDGFAPDRNPDMWDPELMAGVGALSGPRCTVATFTAAGRVRRALQDAGFTMRRVDQRPHKRESLAGEHPGALAAVTRPREVHVVGAGLAGSAVARQLAERGVQVSVHEAGPVVAHGASSIPATVLHPRLLGDGSVHAALRCHAYLYSSAHYAQRLTERPGGALQLPRESEGSPRLSRIAERYQASGDWLELLTPQAAKKRARWPLDAPALWFPHARVLDTRASCAAALDHPNIELRLASHCTEARHRPTVLACGPDCGGFAEARYLEAVAVHGQVDFFSLDRSPAVPLVGNGYLVPWQGSVAAGTTYEHRPWDPEAATAANRRQLVELALAPRWLSRARGARCVSSDRTPIAGRLFDGALKPVDGLYVSTAHGSMGNTFAPFAAELVASLICGEFPPMTRALEAGLSSERFRARQARRGFRHGAG